MERAFTDVLVARGYGQPRGPGALWQRGSVTVADCGDRARVEVPDPRGMLAWDAEIYDPAALGPVLATAERLDGQAPEAAPTDLGPGPYPITPAPAPEAASGPPRAARRWFRPRGRGQHAGGGNGG